MPVLGGADEVTVPFVALRVSAGLPSHRLVPALIYLRMTYSGTDPGPRNIAVFLMIGLIGMGFWLLSAAAETRYSRTPGK
jgi:hypothetical protein